MKSLRIAVWHNLPSGGGKRALFDQVRGLGSRGHYLEAWCPPSADQKFLPLGSLIKEHVRPLETDPPLARSWLARRQQMAWDTGWKMQAMERHCQRCADEMAAGNFDLLLVHPCFFFRTSPIARYSRLPNVLYLQEPYRELYEAWPQLPWGAPQREYRPTSLRYWNEMIRELSILHNKRVQVREEVAWVKSFDQVLVNSFFSRESLMRAYHVEARVCYLGVDTAEFRATGSPKENFVIGLGSLYFSKRPLLALQAVAAIPAAQRPRLVWVGNFADPGLLRQMESEAAQRGVNFTLKVLISDEELRDLLSQAAAMIYTSHLEPFGYAPLEANACGTGVVAIPEGGVRETVNHPDSGHLVPHATPEELAQALQKFTSNLSFATEFGHRARAYVEDKWSQDKAMDRLEAELARVLERK